MADKKDTIKQMVDSNEGSKKQSANPPSMERVRIDESANIPPMESVNTGAGGEKASSNIPVMEKAPSTPVTSKSDNSSED